MQNISSAIQVLDHLTAILGRNPTSTVALICLVAMLVLGFGFAVLGYIVHRLR